MKLWYEVMTMEISLIIPAHNEESNIGATLDAAIKNSHEKFKEIIVVDNASTDRTAEIARRYRGVRVVTEMRKGTGNARQTGAEHASGEILAYIDADTLIPEGWVETIENTFTQNPDVVFLSGAYRHKESERYPVWFLNLMWWFTVIAYWMVGFVGNGGNCAMRASALKKAGGHDRAFAFYGDDTDLARRLHGVGKTIWSLRFFNYSSARRFDEAGAMKTYAQYFMNYWWPILFRRPFTPGYQDTKKS